MTAPDVNADVRARFEAWMASREGFPFAGQFANLMWAAWQAAHADLSGEVRELVEALELAKRAYWLARNSAAGLTNYCEESASSRRCARELSEAESLWHSAGIEAALAKFHPTHQEEP